MIAAKRGHLDIVKYLVEECEAKLDLRSKRVSLLIGKHS